MKWPQFGNLVVSKKPFEGITVKLACGTHMIENHLMQNLHSLMFIDCSYFYKVIINKIMVDFGLFGESVEPITQPIHCSNEAFVRTIG